MKIALIPEAVKPEVYGRSRSNRPRFIFRPFPYHGNHDGQGYKAQYACPRSEAGMKVAHNHIESGAEKVTRKTEQRRPDYTREGVKREKSPQRHPCGANSKGRDHAKTVEKTNTEDQDRSVPLQ